MVYVSFEQFLEEAAFIPGRRLRKRIRKELGDHMEDMLADKIEAGTDEKEAKKQVLSKWATRPFCARLSSARTLPKSA